MGEPRWKGCYGDRISQQMRDTELEKEQASAEAAMVSEVLFYVWDPIGVSSILFARDEYDAYVPEILAILRAGGSSQSVVEALIRLEVEQMELNRPNLRSAHKAAEMLVNWDFGKQPVSPERRMPVP